MCKNKILVFSEFPNDYNIKDGMMQRIKSIDGKLCDYQRTYLEVSVTKYFIIKKQTYKNVKVLKLNILLYFLIVFFYILSAKNIFIHSVHNFMWIWLIFAFFRKDKKNIILDIHGTVPEELDFMGKKIKSRYAGIVEGILFSKVQCAICVTEKMKAYYEKKYSRYSVDYLILPIIPDHLNNACLTQKKKELANKSSKTVFIYAGNTQKWQNVEKIVRVVKRLASCSMYQFIFLTKDIKKISDLLGDSLYNGDIVLKSVQPESLNYYFSLAHYGFILRDDHVLNSVANPTKLMEYLCYGITPIVDFEDIGDMQSYSYEYIKYDSIDCHLKPYKSDRNVEIFKEILAMNMEITDFS